MNLSNLEVFSIKGDTAFIGGKLDNGNFHFIQVPFTDPNFKTNKMSASKVNEHYPDLAELFKHLNMQPVYRVQQPSNCLRMKIWSETYLASLKDGGSIICAVHDADTVLAKLDSQFTKTTMI